METEAWCRRDDSAAPVTSQIPGKYLNFLVTKATDREHVNPERLMLALTRLRDFLIERPDLAILASL